MWWGLIKYLLLFFGMCILLGIVLATFQGMRKSQRVFVGTLFLGSLILLMSILSIADYMNSRDRVGIQAMPIHPGKYEINDFVPGRSSIPASYDLYARVSFKLGEETVTSENFVHLKHSSNKSVYSHIETAAQSALNSIMKKPLWVYYKKVNPRDVITLKSPANMYFYAGFFGIVIALFSLPVAFTLYRYLENVQRR